MAPTIKWTSKAENGRKFRGKPRDTEETALRRQFKKPRRTGEETILKTDALDGREEDPVVTAKVVIEVEETAEVVIVNEDSDGSEDNIPFSISIDFFYSQLISFILIAYSMLNKQS
jgi:hypothetical protein